jgi:hypothetical protein
MQPAHLRHRYHTTRLWRLHRPTLRRVLLQRQVRSILVIILQEQLQMPVQRRFLEDDHMVQTFAAYRADDPLDIGPLLRRSWRSKHFLNAKLLHLLVEIRTEDAVAASQ